MLARVRELFGVEVAARALFDEPTVEGLARYLAAAPRQGASLPPLVRVAREGGRAPLSFAQQRLWFLEQLRPGERRLQHPVRGAGGGAAGGRGAGAEPGRGGASSRGVANAVQGGGGSAGAGGGGGLVRGVAGGGPVGSRAGEQKQAALRQAREEAQRGFDLAEGPLVRGRVLRLSSEEHVVLLTLHHIVSDGWSTGILAGELTALYTAYRAGVASALPELAVQYADYAAWQRGWLQGEVLEEQLGYWKQQLANLPTLQLPTDHPRPAITSSRGARSIAPLPDGLLDRLQTLARTHDATLFMALLAAYQTLLARYSGQADFAVGTPVAGRRLAATEPLIGFFVNQLVLRADLSGNPTFVELLRRARETTVAALGHQDLPFEKLVEELQLKRELSRDPLFQVVLVLQNDPQPEPPGDLRLRPLQIDNETAKFDLTLTVSCQGSEEQLLWEYNTDLYDPATIGRMSAHFVRLLEEIVARPEAEVGDHELLGGEQRERLLVGWNATATDFPLTTLDALFEAQAARTPEAVAVCWQGTEMSYGELDRRANCLAQQLRDLGVGPESRVGLAFERSPELIVSILGVLKAGAAFVPIDPDYPAERVRFMIEDARLAVLLTQERLLERLPPFCGPTLCLDRDWPAIAARPDTPPAVALLPANLAYVIYTSGSTGQPKGTQLTHGGACNLAQAQQRLFGVGLGDRVLQFSALSFDAAVWETLMALMSGAALVVVNREELLGAESGADVADGTDQQRPAAALGPGPAAQ